MMGGGRTVHRFCEMISFCGIVKVELCCFLFVLVIEVIICCFAC